MTPRHDEEATDPAEQRWLVLVEQAVRSQAGYDLAYLPQPVTPADASRWLEGRAR